MAHTFLLHQCWKSEFVNCLPPVFSFRTPLLILDDVSGIASEQEKGKRKKEKTIKASQKHVASL